MTDDTQKQQQENGTGSDFDTGAPDYSNIVLLD